MTLLSRCIDNDSGFNSLLDILWQSVAAEFRPNIRNYKNIFYLDIKTDTSVYSPQDMYTVSQIRLSNSVTKMVFLAS